MSDRAAEGSLGSGAIGIDVDELVIPRRVGKLIDLQLFRLDLHSQNPCLKSPIHPFSSRPILLVLRDSVIQAHFGLERFGWLWPIKKHAESSFLDDRSNLQPRVVDFHRSCVEGLALTAQGARRIPASQTSKITSG